MFDNSEACQPSNELNPEHDSADVFHFNLGSLPDFREEDEESDIEEDVDDLEYCHWLKDNLGDNWEEVYYQTRKLIPATA